MKKFINPDWKALRKLEPSLKQAWFYLWDKCDAIGVYEHDEEYFRIDNGFDIDFNDLLYLPNSVKISGTKILLTDYIIINYGQLKENYNPHKPAFRDLEKSNLSLNSSLTQACPKLEDEEEDKDEEEDEGEEKQKKVVEKSEKEKVVPESPYGDGRLHYLCKVFATENPELYKRKFYESFLEYWTAPIQKGAKKGMEQWRDEKTFQIASRLRTSYNLTWKQNEQTKSKFDAEQERKAGIAEMQRRDIEILTGATFKEPTSSIDNSEKNTGFTEFSMVEGE